MRINGFNLYKVVSLKYSLFLTYIIYAYILIYIYDKYKYRAFLLLVGKCVHSSRSKPTPSSRPSTSFVSKYSKLLPHSCDVRKWKRFDFPLHWTYSQLQT